MKKIMMMSLLLALGIILFPQETQAQYQPYIYSNNAYLNRARARRRNAAKAKGKTTSTRSARKPAAKSKPIAPELTKNKIRKGMTRDEFLNASEVGFDYFDEKNFDKAQIIFEGLADVDSDDKKLNAGVQEALGMIFFSKKDYKKATLHFNEGLNQNRLMPMARLFRAKVLVIEDNIWSAWSDLDYLLDVVLKGQNNDITKEANRMVAEIKKQVYK